MFCADLASKTFSSFTLAIMNFGLAASMSMPRAEVQTHAHYMQAPHVHVHLHLHYATCCNNTWPWAMAIPSGTRLSEIQTHPCIMQHVHLHVHYATCCNMHAAHTHTHGHGLWGMAIPPGFQTHPCQSQRSSPIPQRVQWKRKNPHLQKPKRSL